jgi:hypothetical protein
MAYTLEFWGGEPKGIKPAKKKHATLEAAEQEALRALADMGRELNCRAAHPVMIYDDRDRYVKTIA